MLTLTPGEVHIWIARCVSAAYPPELEKALSQAERDRARRFRLAKDRLVYRFAHTALRHILGRYLNRGPSDIRFGQNPFGKPFLDETESATPLAFNMSHSGALVVIALSVDRNIGVDVEEIRPIDDIAAIAESHFTPEECRFIFSHALPQQERAFFRCWTRKEAYVKAVGRGLSISLNSFETLDAIRQPVRHMSDGPGAREAATWWLRDLDVPSGYLGAVVVEKGVDRMAYFDWERAQG